MAEINSLALLSDANLQAYYRFNTGALTTDSSGNSKTLTNNNTVGEIAGKYGIGADFGTANTNKSLSIADNLGISGGACSMAGWVKLRTEISSSNYCFVMQASGGSNTYFMFRYEYNSGTRRIALLRGNIAVSEAIVYSTISLGTTDWHHLALTYDGTTLHGYIDGADVGNVAASGSGGIGISSSFTIGTDRDGTTYPSNAVIDDVAVFNRALTADEILSLYQEQEQASFLMMF